MSFSFLQTEAEENICFKLITSELQRSIESEVNVLTDLVYRTQQEIVIDQYGASLE